MNWKYVNYKLLINSLIREFSIYVFFLNFRNFLSTSKLSTVSEDIALGACQWPFGFYPNIAVFLRPTAIPSVPVQSSYGRCSRRADQPAPEWKQIQKKVTNEFIINGKKPKAKGIIHILRKAIFDTFWCILGQQPSGIPITRIFTCLSDGRVPAHSWSVTWGIPDRIKPLSWAPYLIRNL